MKTSWKNNLVVCLAIAVLAATGLPALSAQTSPGTATDPGIQIPPSVPSSFATCQSIGGNDAAQENPNGLPLSGVPLSLLPVPLQGLRGQQYFFNSVNSNAAINNLGNVEFDFFCAAAGRFQEIDSVSGALSGTGNCTPTDLAGTGSSGTIPCIESGSGLGPRFNGNSCIMCHFNPTYMGAGAAGASGNPNFSTQNPEATAVPTVFVTATNGVGNQDGGTNSLGTLRSSGAIVANGPVREVRFIDVPGTMTADGGVHDLFTITGRVDATNAINIDSPSATSPNLTTCSEAQPDFRDNLANGNIIFRIPISTLGDGLVELIDDELLEDNLKAMQALGFGTNGTFNRSGNDGTITRFGWKAQNKSMLMFAGEAYNVEQGVSNDLFPNERRGDDDLLNESLATIQACEFMPLPDDFMAFSSAGLSTGINASSISSDITNFAGAMRLSAPPLRNTSAFSPSDLESGEGFFNSVGCAACHTDTTTSGGNMITQPNGSFPIGQGGQLVPAFSDFAIHVMSTAPGTNSEGLPCLNDQVQQGQAMGGQFRTAPLWGLSTRKFLLHDGSASDLVTAIERHDCTNSDAHTVISNFNNNLSSAQQKQLLEFLRSL